MWYTGQFKPGEADGAAYLFYATSRDGITFQRVSEAPVLCPEAPGEKTPLCVPVYCGMRKTGSKDCLQLGTQCRIIT